MRLLKGSKFNILSLLFIPLLLSGCFEPEEKEPNEIDLGIGHVTGMAINRTVTALHINLTVSGTGSYDIKDLVLFIDVVPKIGTDVEFQLVLNEDPFSSRPGHFSIIGYRDPKRTDDSEQNKDSFMAGAGSTYTLLLGLLDNGAPSYADHLIKVNASWNDGTRSARYWIRIPKILPLQGELELKAVEY